MRGKKPVFFNLAITTAAPVFMYMYTMHVLPSLLPSLSADHPRSETLREYLRHVRDYVRLFLQGGVPQAEAQVMDHLRVMVENPTAWEDVVHAIENLL